MRLIFALLGAFLFSCSLAGCSSAKTPVESAPPTVPAMTEAAHVETAPMETEAVLSYEEEILSSMTLREKEGQLFLVRPDALDFSIPFGDLDNSAAEGVTALTESMEDALKDYPVGGFVHFQKNILSPEQISEFNHSLQFSMKIPPFLAVDEEGGLVARLANARGFHLETFKSAAEVGKQGPEAALSMGLTIGGYLKDFGFQMDFAPVADVNTNKNNPVIGSRSFSSDPQEAAILARAMADGLRMQGIAPVFKHFPGHGDTSEDSHLQLAVSHKDKEALQACEWIPFLVAEDRECIMVGHIALPQVTGDQLPATFSKTIVTDLLREELGFEGLIITDSLSMGAVSQSYGSGEAALMALEAGCDLLLMPVSLQEAFDSVVHAVETGSFPQDKLNETVLRILRVKIDYHIIPQT